MAKHWRQQYEHYPVLDAVIQFDKPFWLDEYLMDFGYQPEVIRRKNAEYNQIIYRKVRAGEEVDIESLASDASHKYGLPIAYMRQYMQMVFDFHYPRKDDCSSDTNWEELRLRNLAEVKRVSSAKHIWKPCEDETISYEDLYVEVKELNKRLFDYTLDRNDTNYKRLMDVLQS